MKRTSLLLIGLAGTMIMSCKKDDPVEQTNLSPIVLSGTQSTAITLSDRIEGSAVPDYIIEGEWLLEAGVEVLPGTTIKMKSGAIIRAVNAGYFKATGTSSHKIVISGESPTPGYWGSIVFQSNNVNNYLSHVNISDGGGIQGWDAIIYGYESGRIAINNCTLSNSASNGVELYSPEVLLTEFNSVTIHSCALNAVKIDASDMGAFNESISAYSNGVNRITVNGGSVLVSQTWNKTGVPYFLADYVNVESDVVVSPGAEVICGPGEYISVGSSGSLKAVGTLAEPIIFRGEQNIAGAWGGIRFSNSSSVNNELQYCNVGYGGAIAGWEANVYLYDGSYLTMGNSEIHNSIAYGVIDYNNANTFNDQGNNSFHDNASGDIGN